MAELRLNVKLNLSAEQAVKDVQKELENGLNSVDVAFGSLTEDRRAQKNLNLATAANQKEALEKDQNRANLLRQIANNTKGDLFGSVLTGFLTGFTTNISDSFSNAFIKAFENTSGLSSKSLGDFAGKFSGEITESFRKNIVETAFDFGASGGENLLKRLNLDDLIPVIQKSAVDAAADSLSEAENLFDGVERFAKSFADNISNSKDDFDRVISELTDLSKLASDFKVNAIGGFDSQLSQDILDSLSKELERTGVRETQFKDAIQRTLDRVDELLAENIQTAETEVTDEFTRVFLATEAKSQAEKVADTLRGVTDEAVEGAANAIALILSRQAEEVQIATTQTGTESANQAIKIFESLGFKQSEAAQRQATQAANEAANNIDIEGIKNAVDKLLKTPGVGIEALQSELSELNQQIVNTELIEDEQLKEEAIKLQQQIKAFIENPTLLRSLIELRAILTQQEALAREELSKGTDDAKNNLSNISTELARTQARLLGALFDAPPELVNSFSLIAEEINELRKIIGDLDNSPFVIQSRFAARELKEEFTKVALIGGIPGLKRLQKDINALLTTIKTADVDTDNQEAVQEIDQSLKDLKLRTDRLIELFAKNTRLTFSEIIASPEASLIIFGEQAKQRIREGAIDAANNLSQAVGNGLRLGSEAIIKAIQEKARQDTERLLAPLQNATESLSSGAREIAAAAPANIAKGLVGATKASVNQLQQWEENLFDLVPLLEKAKKATQNIAFPLLAFTAATQIPGVGGAVEALPQFAAGAAEGIANPLAQQLVGRLSELLPDVLSAIPERLAALADTPIVGNLLADLGVSLNTAAAAVGGAISSGVVTTVGQATALLTELIAGQIVTSVGKRAISGVGQQAIRTLSPSVQKELESASDDIGLSNRQIAAISEIVGRNLEGLFDTSKEIKDTGNRINTITQQLNAGLSEFSDQEARQSLELAIAEVRSIKEKTLEAYSQFTQAIASENFELATQLGAVIALLRGQGQARIKEVLAQASELENIDANVLRSLGGTSGAIGRIANQAGAKFKDSLIEQSSPELRQRLFDEFKATGNFALAGFILGLSPQEAAERGEQTGDAFLAGLKEALRIASPSKETEKIAQQAEQGAEKGTNLGNWQNIGETAGEAFSNGVRNGARSAEETFKSASEFAEESAKKASKSADEAFSSDVLGGSFRSFAQTSQDAFEDAPKTAKSFFDSLEESVRSINIFKIAFDGVRALILTTNKILGLLDNNLGKVGLSLSSIVTGFTLTKVAGLAVEQAFFAIENAIEEFITGIFRAGQEFSRIVVSLKQIQGAAAASEGLERITAAAQDNAVAISKLRETYQQFTGALSGTELAGSAVRFAEIIAQTSRFYGLSTQQVEQFGKAVRDIAAKGVVSQEEIRQQGAEALAAFPLIAARSLGKTQQEFAELVETGTLTATEFLPAFFEELSKTTSGAATGVNKVTSSIEQLDIVTIQLANASEELQLNLAQSFAPVAVAGAKVLTATLNALSSSLIFLLQQVRGVVIGFIAFGILKSIRPFLQNFLTVIKDIGKAIRDAAIDKLSTAFKELTTRKVGLAALSGAIALLIEIFIDLSGAINVAAGSVRKATNQVLSDNAAIVTSFNKSSDELEEAAERNAKSLRDNFGGLTVFLGDFINEFSQSIFSGPLLIIRGAVAAFGALFDTLQKGGDIIQNFLDRFGLDISGALERENIIAVAEAQNEANKEFSNAINVLSEFERTGGQNAAQLEVQRQELQNFLALLKNQRPITAEQINANNQLINSTENIIGAIDRQIDSLSKLEPTLAEVVLNTRKLAEQTAVAAEELEVSLTESLAEQGIKREEIDRRLAEQRIANLEANLAAQEAIINNFRERGIFTPDDLPISATKEEEKQLRDSSSEILKLRKSLAEGRIELAEQELDAELKTIEKLVAESENLTERLAQQEEIQARLTIASQEQLDAELERIEERRLNRKLSDINQEIALIRRSGQSQEAISEKIRTLESERGDVTLEILRSQQEEQEDILEQQEAAIQQQDRLNNSAQEELDVRKEILNIRSESLGLERELQQAIASAATARGDLQIARLERVRGIIQELESGDINRRERLNLQRELTTLGINRAVTEREIVSQIASIEERNNRLNLEAKERELEIQREILEIEEQGRLLESRARTLELQSKIAELQQERLEAAQEGRESEIRLIDRQIDLEQKRIEIETRRLGIIEQETDRRQEILATEASIERARQREGNLFRRLDRRRELSSLEGSRFRGIPVGDGSNRLSIPSIEAPINKTNSILSSSQNLLQSIADSLINIEKQQGGGRQENIFNIATSDPRTPRTITNGVINGLTEVLRAF